jgi:hypothetical protein
LPAMALSRRLWRESAGGPRPGAPRAISTSFPGAGAGAAGFRPGSRQIFGAAALRRPCQVRRGPKFGETRKCPARRFCSVVETAARAGNRGRAQRRPRRWPSSPSAQPKPRALSALFAPPFPENLPARRAFPGGGEFGGAGKGGEAAEGAEAKKQFAFGAGQAKESQRNNCYRLVSILVGQNAEVPLRVKP